MMNIGDTVYYIESSGLNNVPTLGSVTEARIEAYDQFSARVELSTGRRLLPGKLFDSREAALKKLRTRLKGHVKRRHEKIRKLMNEKHLARFEIERIDAELGA